MKLQQLFDQTELPKDADTMLENHPLPPEEAERILALTLEKAGLPSQKKGEPTAMKRKIHFGPMILAAALCTGIVAASAAAYVQWDSRLADHLNADETKQAALAPNASDLTASTTSQGWTLSAKQVVGDQIHAYVLLEVAAPEGTVLDADNYFLKHPNLTFGSWMAGRAQSCSWSFHVVEDDDPADNKAAFLMGLEASNSLSGDTVNFTAEGLQAIYWSEDHQNDDVQDIFDGKWELSFKLDYDDAAQTLVYTPNQEIEGDTYYSAAKVKRVEITPLSLSVELEDLTGNSGAESAALSPDEIREKVHADMAALGNIGVELIDKNGSEIKLSGLRSSSSNKKLTFHGAFGKVINPADVTALVIDGVEIPLSK